MKKFIRLYNIFKINMYLNIIKKIIHENKMINNFYYNFNKKNISPNL